MQKRAIDIEKVLELYDENRFVDAYGMTESIWDQPEAFQSLSVEEAIHLGRLAGRLGSQKIRIRLFNGAYNRNPEHPLVQYFARASYRSRFHLFKELSEFERNPDPGFGDVALSASWLGTYACMLGVFRDFERAHELLKRAKDLEAVRPWIACCEAEVLICEDRWEEALPPLESAWDRSPGMPFAASLLGKVFTRIGRLDEAVDRLLPQAENGQSYETTFSTLWCLFVQAERSDDGRQKKIASKAYDLSSRLFDMAPLADTATRSQIAHLQMDAAILLEDKELMKKHAIETKSPFFQAVFDNIEKSPQAKRVILSIKPAYQKHQTCLPTSIATVLSYFDVHIDGDALAAELTFSGTAIWRIIDWLKKRHFLVKPFVVTPSLARSLLKAGLPFVYMTESVYTYHATAAVGINEMSGVLIIHDPSYERWDRILIDKIGLYEAPFGPEALAVVPADKSKLLDLIPIEASAPFLAYIGYQKIRETKGPRSGSRIIETLNKKYPDHPYTWRLKAIHLGLMGDLFTAIRIQEKLLEQHPHCHSLHRELLDNLYITKNTTKLRKSFERIVSRRRLPGNREKQSWRYPPATYVARYADFIGVSPKELKKGEKMLWRALGREPFHAEGYHVLGDLFIRQDRVEESILPLRCAALLSDETHHYARELSDVLRRVGRDEEGIQYLRSRVKRLGQKLQGGSVWITLIGALEDYGLPEEAIEAMEGAQSLWEKDAPLNAYASEFWIRMGRWVDAEKALQRVKESGHRPFYLQAAVYFYQRSGQWGKALAFCAEWIREVPENIFARQQYIHLYAMKHGRLKALSLSEQWMGRHKGHDEFEEILYNELKWHFKVDRQEQLLLKRLKRNPYDAWALHELGFVLLNRAETCARDDYEKILERANKILSRCDQLCPDHAVTFVLKAQMAETQQNHKKATDLFLEALSVDPEYNYCYNRIWESSAALPEEYQRKILEDLEKKLFQGVGFLHNARDLAFRIAERFGVREARKAVNRWQRKAPADPEVIEANADLLLHYGQGRSDAEKAVLLLEAAVKKFPNHFDLRHSLAHAYEMTLRESDEMTAMREIIRRYPLNMTIRNKLARVMAHRGEQDQAEQVLREGIRCDPLTIEAWHSLTMLLWDFGKPSEALSTIERGLKKLPEDITLRRTIIDLLHEAGDHHRAVSVAKEGIELYQNGAFLWYLYGEALWRGETQTDVSEIERAFRKSLELNATLFDAADSLAIFLCGRKAFSEARQLMKDQISVMNDPCRAHGRLAWISRQEGKKRDALQSMVRTIRRWPRYEWGWRLLLDWLRIDEDWEFTKEILSDVHPVILDNPTFNSERLLLLEKAGTNPQALDAEWDRLLHNFPDNETIHLDRFDLLRDRELWELAEKVLKSVERFHPNSPYIMARKIQLLAHRDHLDEVMKCALKLWQLPGQEDIWPEENVWETLESVGYTGDAAVAALNLIKSGKPIRRRTFAYMLEHFESTLQDRDSLLAKKPRKRKGPPVIIAGLLALLNDLDRNGIDDDGYCKAMVLDKMRDLGAPRDALDYWKRNRETCYWQTPVWQSMGSVLLSGGVGDLKGVRELMADWRKHPGCEMWAVANYALSLRKIRGKGGLPEDDLDELYATSRDVLKLLHHDHTVKYHVCILCETTLRRRQDRAFIQHVKRYEPLLRDETGHYWLSEDYKWAPEVILLFRELLMTGNVDRMMELTKSLRQQMKPRCRPWVRREWLHRLKGKVSFSKYLLAGMKLRHF